MHPLMPLHAVIGLCGALALVACLVLGFPRLALFVTALASYSWGALIVEGLSRVPGLLRAWHYRDWDGIYLEFDGRQVRVVEDPDGTPWVWLDDALRELHLTRPGLKLGGLDALALRQPERGPAMVSLAGVQRLARVARDPAAARFARWFERQVHEPALRRAARSDPGGRP
ncbi:MAG: hypothetical protein KDH20_12340 [Rhodocyclaceae bacterium]|nr:hypothetical protein [Rhodocyclaceae bacterium]